MSKKHKMRKRVTALEIARDNITRSEVFKGIFTGRKRQFALRMAPMIDVVFLLLLFFLVAAKWRPDEDFLPLQLPATEAQAQRVGKPEPLIIYIFAAEGGCDVQIGQLQAIQIKDQTIEENLAALMGQINRCLTAQKRYASDPIEIVCSPEVKWDYLAKIYNMFFGAGLTDITFAMTE